MLSDSISIAYSAIPHQDTLYQINYCHPPSSVPIFVHFPPPHPPHQTIFQFIIRPKFSSIIVTHHPPSEEQSTFCYLILYLLVIPSPPSGYPILYQLSSPPIIISRHPHHQTLFQFISRPHFRSYLSSPYVTPISRFHQSVSLEHQSISPDPIIQFHHSINQFTRP